MNWREHTKNLGQRLESSLRAVLAWLDEPDALLDFRSDPTVWTVREISEHVALTNRYLLILIEKIAARSRTRRDRGDAPPPVPSRIDHLEDLAARDFRWSHPEHMTPRGEHDSAAVRAELEQQLATTTALLAELPDGEGALHRIRMSVVGGSDGDDRLDLYQFLAIIALHAERHVRQMERSRLARSGSQMKANES